MSIFKLDTKSGLPFYRQIVDQIRLGIANGDIANGEQLPTVRALAVELQINFHTVNKAYKELEWQGLVTTQQGTGTFVTGELVELSATQRQEKLKEFVNTFLSSATQYGFSKEDLILYLENMRDKT